MNDGSTCDGSDFSDTYRCLKTNSFLIGGESQEAQCSISIRKCCFNHEEEDAEHLHNFMHPDVEWKTFKIGIGEEAIITREGRLIILKKKES